jgi:two-component system, cell cycle sensor histidine kinase and response regulator CckA
VELAATTEPDVFLLDFQMPMMNGLDAARKIIESNPAIPIAMYTLHQNDFFEAQARAAGVRKVVSKTDLFSTLSSSLHELVGPSKSATRQTGKTKKKNRARKISRKRRK